MVGYRWDGHALTAADEESALAVLTARHGGALPQSAAGAPADIADPFARQLSDEAR